MDTSEHQMQFLAWTRDHAAILHHVVNGFASGADRHDLLQEVMLAIWKSIPAFRNQAKPSTYLYRVCHNAALTWTRSEKNHRLRVERLSAQADVWNEAEASSSTDERLEQLYTAIHGLRPIDRSLMLLVLDGLSYREMAEVLGLTESNIGIKINRIKIQLHQTLKGNPHGPR